MAGRFNIDGEVSETNSHQSDEEEEYEVEAILDKRDRRGVPQYLAKWKGYPTDDATWEYVEDLCQYRYLAEDYDKDLKTKEKVAKNVSSLKPKVVPSSSSSSSSEQGVLQSGKSVNTPCCSNANIADTQRPTLATSLATGFDRGLEAEKIIGATEISGELVFLIEWHGSEQRDFVPARVANVVVLRWSLSFMRSTTRGDKCNCNNDSSW